MASTTLHVLFAGSSSPVEKLSVPLAGLCLDDLFGPGSADVTALTGGCMLFEPMALRYVSEVLADAHAMLWSGGEATGPSFDCPHPSRHSQNARRSPLMLTCDPVVDPILRVE
jgi:hypothetical protein